MKHLNPRAILGCAFAEVLRPPEASTPSQWAAKHLIVPDGPHAGAVFDLKLAPYLAEPLDMLGPDSAVNEIAVMKSAQSGFTLLLLAFLGFIIDRAPSRALLVQPTSDAVADFNRGKLDPAIRASPALCRKVARQTSRSAEGSTTYSKAFPGGSLTLAISSSAADLRSKTVKILLRDEIDQYPDDLDGQGDPLKISDGRLIAFLASGDWRKADISTPTIKGGSKIERRYEAGDQRRWHVPCPHCGAEFVFEFGANFRFEQAYPYKAHYVTPCCGVIIEPHEKRDIVGRGRWIATASRPGAFPSYHLDGLTSPFVPWDALAAEFVSAGDDPQRLKAFRNLFLGLPYEARGDAPDHVRLLERREEGLKQGHIPPRGLMLTAAADIQMRGIWLEVVAWAGNRESWTVDFRYLDGSTESPDGEAFVQLAHWLERDWPDAFGRSRKLDALGVDSGYRSHVVYAWARRWQRVRRDGGSVVHVLKGLDGWGKPALGAPNLVDINLEGARLLKGARVWGVGTWPLKSAFYADLNKAGRKSGAAEDPAGYCHFGEFLDENYFRQLTSEYLAERTYRGRVRREWKQISGRDNHGLDCRVYNMALAEQLGLSIWTPAEIAVFTKERCTPPSDTLPLFQSMGAPGVADASNPDHPMAATAASERANAPSAAIGGAGAQFEADDLDARLVRALKEQSEAFGQRPKP